MAKTPAQIADASLKDLVTETCEHVIRTRQELRSYLIYAAVLARQASWDQYADVCAVIDQAKTDDMAGLGVARRGQIEVAARGLDGIDDGGRRIEQRAIPVEDDQFVFHAFQRFFPRICSRLPAPNSRTFAASTAAI